MKTVRVTKKISLFYSTSSFQISIGFFADVGYIRLEFEFFQNDFAHEGGQQWNERELEKLLVHNLGN